MPLSRKRKKKGKPVKGDPATRLERAGDQKSGVSLQDLINVVAYQENQKTKAAKEEDG